MNRKLVSLSMLFLFFVTTLSGCYRPQARYDEPWQVPTVKPTVTIQPTSTHPPLVEVSPTPVDLPMVTPTADIPKILPTIRSESVDYVVKQGDNLAKIALAHQVSVAQILEANPLENPNIINAGQLLHIPPATINEQATSFKIIPDSELVYGPNAADFNIVEVISRGGGYLLTYSQALDEGTFNGAEIVARVANEYSVNPRLLLALLEYRSGWLTNPTPNTKMLDYPMGFENQYRKGLYLQLGWAANALNLGFYLWNENGLAVWTLSDGIVMRIDPTINAGTAGVQYLMSLFHGASDWREAVEEDGFITVYESLFGYPFNYAFEPLLPAGLSQPELVLPFEPGDLWYYTSGPHGGWNSGSAWAALDFAPPGEPMGCYPSTDYVTASAAGMVVRTGLGAVVQDLDGDGIEQTGWTILYMHIATDGSTVKGNYLAVGDPVGFASCEGGFSSGTHVHIARRYNGVWIAADGSIPFVMDGWTAISAGIEYDGYLSKDGQTIEAWNGQTDFNQISR